MGFIISTYTQYRPETDPMNLMNWLHNTSGMKLQSLCNSLFFKLLNTKFPSTGHLVCFVSLLWYPGLLQAAEKLVGDRYR